MFDHEANKVFEWEITTENTDGWHGSHSCSAAPATVFYKPANFPAGRAIK